MQEVITKDGIKINGLYRTPTGALVVYNPSEYSKYNKQHQYVKTQDLKIQSLENDIESLKYLVNELLKKQNG